MRHPLLQANHAPKNTNSHAYCRASNDFQQSFNDHYAFSGWITEKAKIKHMTLSFKNFDTIRQIP
jgi:hypothetical protein